MNIYLIQIRYYFDQYNYRHPYDKKFSSQEDAIQDMRNSHHYYNLVYIIATFKANG